MFLNRNKDCRRVFIKSLHFSPNSTLLFSLQYQGVCKKEVPNIFFHVIFLNFLMPSVIHSYLIVSRYTM